MEYGRSGPWGGQLGLEGGQVGLEGRTHGQLGKGWGLGGAGGREGAPRRGEGLLLGLHPAPQQWPGCAVLHSPAPNH